MEEKIKIYVATHKEAEFPKEEIYVPLQVGAEGKNDLGYIKDNTGDNISNKNANYCELTGAYWIWKNDKSDIVGLTHYRRYFFNKNTNKLSEVLTENEINKILEQYDIIVPKKNRILRDTVRQAYCKFHKEKDLEECRNVIEEKYPEYIESFNKIMEGKQFYICNMFIASKKIFDEYYKWCFDILLELEKRTDISDYDNYNKRIYGFMSERLFNVWLNYHKELKIKEMPVYNTDKKILPQFIENKIKSLIIRK